MRLFRLLLDIFVIVILAFTALSLIVPMFVIIGNLIVIVISAFFPIALALCAIWAVLKIFK